MRHPDIARVRRHLRKAYDYTIEARYIERDVNFMLAEMCLGYSIKELRPRGDEDKKEWLGRFILDAYETSELEQYILDDIYDASDSLLFVEEQLREQRRLGEQEQRLLGDAVFSMELARKMLQLLRKEPETFEELQEATKNISTIEVSKTVFNEICVEHSKRGCFFADSVSLAWYVICHTQLNDRAEKKEEEKV